MKKFFPFAATMMLAYGSAPATAAPSAPLAPTGKWVVDFAEHQCLATRGYGTAEKPVFLALKPSPMGEVMQIVLVLETSGSRVPRQARVAIGIDGAAPVRSNMLAFNAKEGGLRSIRVNLPLESFAPMREATEVSIAADGEIEESFVLAQMPSLMAAMDRCVAGLRQYWNIEDEARAKLRSRASGNLFRYFSSNDYPAAAIRAGASGTMEYALLIDEAGKVADCTLTATSNVPVLDAQSCAILIERARLTPAVGADGKPAKDAMTGRITWALP